MAYFRKKARVVKITKAKAKRNYRRKSSGGVKSLVAQMIKTSLHKQLENKEQSLVFNTTNFNNGATLVGDVIKIIPVISQGLEGGQRVGDTITARSFNLKGHMCIIPAGNDVPRSRIMVRIMVVVPRKFPTNDVAQLGIANWLPYVLKLGNDGVALDGTIRSMYLPVNKEIITTLVDKKYYLNADYFKNDSSENYATNLACKFFNFNFKVKDKVLRYNGDLSDEPTNYSPTLLFSFAFLDGSSPSVLSTSMSMTFVSTLSYEDA